MAKQGNHFSARFAKCKAPRQRARSKTWRRLAAQLATQGPGWTRQRLGVRGLLPRFWLRRLMAKRGNHFSTRFAKCKAPRQRARSKTWGRLAAQLATQGPGWTRQRF